MNISSQHCGFITLVGLPNAGKSTLLNALVGTKVSIVSAKAQTTRTRITGILVDGAAQAIFVDTPGLLTSPKRKLEKAMLFSAIQGLDEGDITVAVVDAAKGEKGIEPVRNAVAKRNGIRVLVLNKIDIIRYESLLKLSQSLNEQLAFDHTFMISALENKGVDDLRRTLLKALPPAPWLFPDDEVTNLPERFLAAEVTREKLFEALHQELPYNLTVETQSYESKPNGIHIHQDVFVSRQSHKRMVIGNRGRMLNKVGQQARLELETLYEQRVHLFLFVKVRENWMSDPQRYSAMRLDMYKG